MVTWNLARVLHAALKKRICRTDMSACDTSTTWPAEHAMPRSSDLRRGGGGARRVTARGGT
eukprot:5056354-Prymnesium_polylepis.1